MEIEKSALADQILFEDEEESAQESGAARPCTEELIDRELEGAEYYFTEASFEAASQTLRSILADYAPIETYPDSLQKLMCFHHVYPIFKARSKVTWPRALGYLIMALVSWFISDLSVSYYVTSGLLLRIFFFGVALATITLFGYSSAAALTSIVSYLRCKEARVLFRTKAQYTGQGNCIYKGKNADGLDRFSASVRMPFTLVSGKELLKEVDDPSDIIEDSLEEMIEKDPGSGILFSVLCIGATLWLLLSTLSWYGISLIDFLWVFW